MNKSFDTFTPYINAGEFPKPLRIIANIFSYLFHPVFIPAYVAYYLLMIHPMFSVIIHPFDRINNLIMVIVNTVIFPSVIVLLMWRLKFIKSIRLDTQKDRIMPLVGSITFYFWAFYVGRNVETIPTPLKIWLMGAFLGSSIAMFLNIYQKVSLHGIGMGGLVGFTCWLFSTDPYLHPSYVIISILFAGIVGTSRILLGAHSPKEVYSGFIGGILSQVIAIFVIG